MFVGNHKTFSVGEISLCRERRAYVLVVDLATAMHKSAPNGISGYRNDNLRIRLVVVVMALKSFSTPRRF